MTISKRDRQNLAVHSENKTPLLMEIIAKHDAGDDVTEELENWSGLGTSGDDAFSIGGYQVIDYPDGFGMFYHGFEMRFTASTSLSPEDC